MPDKLRAILSFSNLFILSLSLVFFKSSLSFAQVKTDNFIKKEEIKSSFTVEGNTTDNQVRSILNSKSDQSKVYVFFENKFYTIDTLKKIKNVN